MWPSSKDIPLFVGVPVNMTHRVVVMVVAVTLRVTLLLIAEVLVV